MSLPMSALPKRFFTPEEYLELEQHTRQPSGVWTYAEYEHPTNCLRLKSVDCEVPLGKIHDQVQFPALGR